MTRRNVIIGGVLAAVLFGMWYLHGRTDTPPEGPRLNVSSLRAEFESLIQSEGAEAAYRSFVETYSSQSLAAHSVMHVFGETLYTTGGVDAVVACGPELEYGCYHGFFTQAVKREGISIVGQLDAACRNTTGEQITACQHGLGHGIIEFLGVDKLKEALEVCNQVPHDSPLGGCFSGVFMQYNVPQTVAENGTFQSTTRTPVDPGSPYDPCPTLPAAYQPACYHSLGQWWEKLYAPHYERMGRLCALVPDYSYRTTCFHGLATAMTSSAEFESGEIIRRCRLMPDEESQTLCLRVAASSVERRTHDTFRPALICAALGTTSYECPGDVSALSGS